MNLGKPLAELIVEPDDVNAADLADALERVEPVPAPEPVSPASSVLAGRRSTSTC